MAFKGFRLLLVGIGLLCAQVTSAQQYTVTDLGTLDGSGYSEARAINASGQVVGLSGNFRAVLWDNGAMKDLGALPGYGSCLANSINDAAQVVGACLGSDASGIKSRAFLWTADTGMKDLGTPDGSDNWREVRANGIANTGEIVGWVFATGAFHARAFVYRAGAFQLFEETFGGANAYNVNDQGQIVGCCIGTNFHAVLWDDAGSHDLGSMADLDGQPNSVAKAISADGLIVGYSTTGDGVQNHYHAVLWNPYGIANLGTLGGTTARAEAINGQLLVGSSETAQGDTHAFFYDNEGPGYPVDLNDLVPPGAGLVLNFATGINAAGQIAGFGRVNSGATHAFLLTPVPPTTTPQ